MKLSLSLILFFNTYGWAQAPQLFQLRLLSATSCFKDTVDRSKLDRSALLDHRQELAGTGGSEERDEKLKTLTAELQQKYCSDQNVAFGRWAAQSCEIEIENFGADRLVFDRWKVEITGVRCRPVIECMVTEEQFFAYHGSVSLRRAKGALIPEQCVPPLPRLVDEKPARNPFAARK